MGVNQGVAIVTTGHQAVLDRRAVAQHVDELQSNDDQQKHHRHRRETRGLPLGGRAFILRAREPLLGRQPRRGYHRRPSGGSLARRPGAAKHKHETDAVTTMTIGRRHLSKVDPALAALCRRIGPCRLTVERTREPYEVLVRAIAHQQLHGRAAEMILGRFVALYPGTDFPSPEAVLATDETLLRACGFSGGKIAAIRDIAHHAVGGGVPTRRVAARLDDETLIERLTAIRGVGRWTVEMLLIFSLGRRDVLPVDDFGVREGYRLLHGLEAQPKPKELAQIGLTWAPHRSTAAWYLWRAADAGKKAPVPSEVTGG